MVWNLSFGFQEDEGDGRGYEDKDIVNLILFIGLWYRADVVGSFCNYKMNLYSVIYSSDAIV